MGSEAQEAFERLKKLICTYPYLAITYFSVPFTVECDASKLGIGSMFMQNGQQIAFESQNLSNKKYIFSIYEKEMLVIMHALQRFMKYLVYGPFIIQNDHNSLKYFLILMNLSEK